MIFATVGTQLPFDRLLHALDSWAALNRQVRVVAQTGRTVASFAHLQARPNLDQRSFAETFAAARVIVAHAGMGTILTALELGKPLILMPRRADLGEHRNDHQLDTAAEMAALSNVTVVEDRSALHEALDAALSTAPVQATPAPAVAPPPLIEAVRAFIWDGTKHEARP